MLPQAGFQLTDLLQFLKDFLGKQLKKRILELTSRQLYVLLWSGDILFAFTCLFFKHLK